MHARSSMCEFQDRTIETGAAATDESQRHHEPHRRFHRCPGNDRVAARRIADDDIGAFPALSEGKLAGIVTDRDIALRCVAERIPASASQQRSPIFASRTGQHCQAALCA